MLYLSTCCGHYLKVATISFSTSEGMGGYNSRAVTNRGWRPIAERYGSSLPVISKAIRVFELLGQYDKYYYNW